MKTFFSRLPTLFKLSYQDWKEDRASRLSAALAYYTIFSLAPMLVLVIAITGLIWQVDVVRAQLLTQVQSLVGAQGADFIATLITSRSTPRQDIFATIVGIITLLFGALGVFNELHNSLNIIWNVQEEKPKGFLGTVKKVILDRLLSFTMILGIGFLLLVSLVISTGLSAVQQTVGNLLPFSETILQLINLVISTGVITVLFALMFKFLPDAEIAWRDVWLGAFVTALLFSIGKALIGVYLGNTSVISSFGAAGSLILLLLWIYYSAEILFFGAEFTQVYANKYGSKIVPEGEEAVAAPAREAAWLRGRRPTPAPLVSPQLGQYSRRLERDRPVIPSTGADLERDSQTARLFAGLMAASFLTGILTTFFGLRKRR